MVWKVKKFSRFEKMDQNLEDSQKHRVDEVIPHKLID